ncbi:hypothetical protein AA313_de0209441 [Arthrobotrys entomopaga]|nr:hypothetical protein AA313_de0209441 [Arthrobotrys entomopaga]
MKISQIVSIVFLVAAASAAPPAVKGPAATQPLHPTLPPLTGAQLKSKAMAEHLPPAKATFMKGLDQTVWDKLAVVINEARAEVTKGANAKDAQKKAEAAWNSIYNGQLPAGFKNLQTTKPQTASRSGTNPQKPVSTQQKPVSTQQKPANSPHGSVASQRTPGSTRQAPAGQQKMGSPKSNTGKN